MATLFAAGGALGALASVIALILVRVQWASQLIEAYGPLPVAVGAGIPFTVFGVITIIASTFAFD